MSRISNFPGWPGSVRCAVAWSAQVLEFTVLEFTFAICWDWRIIAADGITRSVMWSTPATAVEQQLSLGERLLWSGQPRRGIRLRPLDAFVIPFSLLWCGFAAFWEASVITKGAPFFFKLWGVLFVLVGLYIVFGRFFVDATTRERTFYGVTTERIIIVGGLFSRQITSLQLRTLSGISLTERPDGSGTIAFGPQHPMAQRLPSGWPGAGRYAAPAFEMVERAREIYDLIRQTQRTAT